LIDFNYTILIQFANILIVLILLNAFLFKPVLKALNKRDTAISSLSGKSQDIKQDLSNLEKIKERRRPILESKDALLSNAHKDSMHVIEKTRADLTDELTRLKGEIEKDSKKVYDSMKIEVEKLSADAARKILKRSF